MPRIPTISAAEWSIMKVLWQRPREWLVAADVIDPVTQERSIHHRTARTLLARLVKKKAVETRPASSGGGYLYRAKVSQEQAVRAESRSFLSRVFDGNAAPALVHLLQESGGKLSPEELKDLRDLLKSKEKP
jgi:BlaI family transcriptional regulator, penicillinase repressor